ncbi:HsdR family type I site-specific deoxyribonuclease [Lactobacillus helveticus]|uniref:type I restriction endonuclease subunit R, EcoR124 family n=1 Tax=Lactobacillus helveticus TaxID=1587 RepID=UPI00081A5F57|nr:HsdR family type I site-specific deoxyribonuclease [Lactobacillus helveticus]ANZ55423.1 restriction endonuclease subunit R [Lactobacillus helveticus]AQY53533.1 restriction endonuclease subunit R [Lactobacillus helveticus]MBU6035119.1 HsdR family type I site-specific deoxyribonuclease [Lactobacillus helveticus]MBW1219705.1 HsdR family type I site-specific deoxyribonuclease [Lactobacillus helveticus]MDY0876184.1 HsdR family type I site-specific deoxyribonuclease [Lactobacillus helveticus]
MEQENVLEQNLIDQLTHGESQWTLRDDIKNEDDLWNNFFEILSRSNKDVLKDVPLTDNEKAIIKSKIIHPTFYKSAEWLAGVNGEVRLQIQRDNTQLGTADFIVINNNNIAGGNSVYEVVHQIQFHKRREIDCNRRGDVTLLINGLPMIHIELKNRTHSPKEAFNQIQKYIDEQMFNGIFSTLQFFVVTNGSYTQYIAAGQQLKEKFLTTWVDKENKPVQNYLEFAKDVLSIPAAHNMVANYIALDSTQRSIIVLRPYQIHAIQAIFDASYGKDNKDQPYSGFVWHTTGSGKTLTSYKVAHNLLKIPSIQKTIFLIDRNDLDTQTTQAFETYAQNDSIDVEGTENSYSLARKLVSSDKRVIVTTRQKMQALFKRIAQDQEQKRLYRKLKDVKLAFIVDECHRAVSPDQKNEIDAFFTKNPPLWYGFTGTPIFAENAREAKGNNARTTEQQYGKCLHKYTIKDAIRDKAVLGFQVEEESNVSEDADESDTDARNKEYASLSHMKAVVKRILNNSYRKLGIYNKDNRGYTYDAIFTTSSIKQAQKYYRIFRDVINDKDPDIKIPNRIKKVLPDFPKIAITYSIGENGDGDEANQNEMKQSLEDYNKMFNTHYSMAELGAYNTNVNDRLARKKDEFKPRSQQLDIVIVVDRLLTGFDAPCLSTLFLDRAPMPYKDLIQAFSRTNRIFDRDKRYGQIVTYQYPKKYKESINGALMLYTEGSEKQALAPTWDESILQFNNAAKKIIKYQGDQGIPITEAPLDDQKRFLKEYQDFDKSLGAIKTYNEFNNIDLEKDYDLDPMFIEDTRATYEVVKEKVREATGKDKPATEDDDQFDPDYELENTGRQEINYAYIVQLIQAYIPSDDKENNKRTKAEVKEIDDYIENLGKNNKSLADIVNNLWFQIKFDPEKFRNKQVNELLQNMIDDAREDLIKKFADENGLNIDNLKFVIRHYDPNEVDHQQTGINALLSFKVFSEFRKTHPDMNMLQWKKKVRLGLNKFYQDQISPLENKD